jgi:hypothetical protein
MASPTQRATAASSSSSSSSSRPRINPYFSLSLNESTMCSGGNEDGEFGLSEMTLMADDEDDDLVECVVFTQKDLASVSMPVMEDIRRMGKLCDVTIKVGNGWKAIQITRARST